MGYCGGARVEVGLTYYDVGLHPVGKRAAHRAEFQNPVVRKVGDPEIAFGVEGRAVRKVEPALTRCLGSGGKITLADYLGCSHARPGKVGGNAVERVPPVRMILGEMDCEIC